MKQFPTLYAVSKTGKVLRYSVYVDQYQDESSLEIVGMITQETGQVGGKQIKKEKLVLYGKNKGKVNETTPYEQACSEAESDWTKKLKEGYKTLEWLESKEPPLSDLHLWWSGDELAKRIFEEAKIKFNIDHNDRTKPMLADKWKNHKDKVKYPVLVQPKYNGVRCKIGKYDGKIQFLSREGEIYEVPHILDTLPKYGSLFDNGNELDGELYVHGKPLQDIVHLVKSPNIFSTEVVFKCYDYCNIQTPNLSMKERAAYRDLLVTQIGSPYIQITTEWLCNNEEEVMQVFKQCREEGYEGVIVRDLKATYQFGFRDKALLKIKEVMSAEFEIRGTSLKSGSNIEDFVWTCITKEGLYFEVKPHGTVEQRKEQYLNGDAYLGKKLQLDFYEYTKDKIPFHVTSVTIRDYE